MLRRWLVLVLTLFAALPAHPERAFPQGPGDTPITDHAVGYYDERSRRVVMVGAGGNPGPEDRDMVWSWNGQRWEREPGEGPPGRVNAGAAFARGPAAAVVAGGSRKASDESWTVVGDSWTRDGKGWTRIADIPARDHHALVEDQAGAVLLFGGIPARRTDPWPTDTWSLSGNRWSRVATEGPPARGRPALAYDAWRRQVVLFGGVSAPQGPDQSQTFFSDTWIWDARRWRKVAGSGPRGRYAHGMTFDDRRGLVLLYGGAAAHKGAPLQDLWQWDGSRWTELHPEGPAPGHRYQPVMVHDRARGVTILYGGIGGPADTWEWNGRVWRLASSATAS